MATGRDMLALALRHIGEPHRHVIVPKTNPNWRGPWDCAEFASWLVFQQAHILYGCINDSANPVLADAYTGAWQRDARRIGQWVPVEEAAATLGGFLLRFGPAPGDTGHIVICDGNGGTVEARGAAYGVVAHTVQGRHWDIGVLVPHIAYEPPNPGFHWRRPGSLYAMDWPNMDAGVVEAIQRALAAQGRDPGAIDGVFGPGTAAAVMAFQAMTGLVVDGQVGVETAHALSIGLMVSR